MKYRKGIISQHNKEPYIYITHSDLLKALKSLSGSSFKVWIYFSRHHISIISDEKQRDILINIGISRSTYVSAMDELIKKGFIIEQDGIYVTLIPDEQDIDDYEI